MDYEQGLIRIESSIEGTSWYADFHVFVNHLRDNLEEEKRYGMSDVLNVARLSILEQLEQLTVYHFGMSFDDLCREKRMQDVISPKVTEKKLLENKSVEISIMPTHTERNKAFISYNRKDRKYLDVLHAHLAYDARTGTIDFWDGSRIPPGSRWREEIEKALAATRIAVLMVSADFLASDFIANNELPPLLKAEAEGGALIYCVILRPCVFNYTELAQFEAINPPSRPLSTMNEAEQEDVWVKLANLIRQNLRPAKQSATE